MRVFVLDSSNSPLTPCHPARARMLLARGRAEVEARTPFTIRLKEARPDAVVVPVAMGIDDGAKEVGFSVVMSQKQGIVVVTKGVIRLRQDIREIMQERRNHRRQRRKRLGYRQARFDNRKRQEGWVPPSIRAKKEAIARVVKDFSARCIVCRARHSLGGNWARLRK